MRLASVIACLLIAATAGCGPSGGHRDAAAMDPAGLRTDAPASSGRTAAADYESAIEANSRIAQTATMEATDIEDEAARAECRKSSATPSGVEDESAMESCRRTALLLGVDVRDLRTGAPAPGVAVGSGHTDARGHHEERRPMPYPGERIEVRCPARINEMQGRLLGTSLITVNHGVAYAAFDVEAHCMEPTPHRMRRRFAGLYASGFETSNFLPCEGIPAEAAYYTWPHSYWVEMPSAVRNALDRAAPPELESTPRIPRFPIGIRKAYVEWLATETGPGLYGHMGNGLYQLDVETLYRVSASPPASCRPPGWEQFGRPPPRVDPRDRPFPFER